MKTATSGVSFTADPKLHAPVRFALSNGIPCTLLAIPEPAQSKLILRFNHDTFFSLHYPIAKLAVASAEDAVNNRLSLLSVNAWSPVTITRHRIAPDYASLEVVFPEEMLEETLSAIAESLQYRHLTAESASRYKEQLFNNCVGKRMQPRNRASELLMEQLFNNHPCGRTLRPEDISSVDVANPGDLLSSFVQAASPWIYLAVHNTRKAASKLEQIFGNRPDWQSNQAAKAKTLLPDGQPRSSGSRIHIGMDSSDTGSIRIGRRIFGMEHTEYPAARMALAILGGYFSSRLMARLREHKGYAHGIGAGIRSLSAGSYLFISAEVGNPWIGDALGEIDRELTRLASEPVEKEELVTVLLYLEAGIRRQISQQFSYLDALATLDRFGLEYSWHEQFILNINKLNPSDISRFMAQYMCPADLITVTCGKTHAT